MNISLSQIDKQHFDITIAIAQYVCVDDVDEAELFCEANHVEMCIARVPTTDLRAMQKLEDMGYRMMDTLVYYAFKFNKKAIPPIDSSHQIRSANNNDIPAVIDIATESFRGYYGHYHADSRLPKDKSDAVYVDWAQKSVQSREMADEVLVVTHEDRLDGFATLRQNTEREGEGVLFGVAPHAQGQGIYRTMMIHGLHWCQNQGHERMVVSTQVTNIAVQKVWARLGFEMDRSYYTLHKWF